MGLGYQGVVALPIALIARHAGDASRQHSDFGGAFVAHGLNRLRVRAYEHEAGVLHRLRKRRTLRQKAIARMDSPGAAALGCRNQFFYG